MRGGRSRHTEPPLLSLSCGCIKWLQALGKRREGVSWCRAPRPRLAALLLVRVLLALSPLSLLQMGAVGGPGAPRRPAEQGRKSQGWGVPGSLLASRAGDQGVSRHLGKDPGAGPHCRLLTFVGPPACARGWRGPGAVAGVTDSAKSLKGDLRELRSSRALRDAPGAGRRRAEGPLSHVSRVPSVCGGVARVWDPRLCLHG